MMNGKYLLTALAALMLAAGCQRHQAADETAKALAHCDSIIQACTDSLSSKDPLMMEYQVQAALIDKLHEAYTKKERLLEERIVNHSEGDMKLLFYQEFERGHRLYDAWAEQNDSIVYATDPLGAPWIECRSQRIDKLFEHIRILQQHTKWQ